MRITTITLALFTAAVSARAAELADVAALEFFEKKIRPVLADNCFGCHSVQAKKAKGGLRLDSRTGLLKGGDNGPALVPGMPEKSRLITAINYKDVDLQMPPKAKLPDAAIADLTAWVKMGAPWPATAVRPSVEHKAGEHEFDLGARRAAHWAWQPIRAIEPPAVKNGARARGPIDRFILAGLEERGFTPAGPADRRTLIRRASLNITGLPPTVEEVEAFAGDDRPDAFERLVDRLLASPAFGEHWARHWLDLVRYAESRGHEFDYLLPNAWQYRDYVIRALNADVRYDDFVREHLAGDLLSNPRRHPTAGFNESVLGTGFWFLGEEVHSPVDTRADEADRTDNKIDVFGKTFLGLTIACARCHDHKFDAISTRDYYALFGIIQSSAYRQVRFETEDAHRRTATELRRLRRTASAEALPQLAARLGPGVEKLAAYLSAAGEAVRAGSARNVAAIAASHKLDAAVLGRWVEHLPTAAKDPDDPFHAFAVIAADAKFGEPARFAELRKSLRESLSPRGGAAARDIPVIADYANPQTVESLADGPTFIGRRGDEFDLRIGGGARLPVLSMVTAGAAEADRSWDGLKTAAGTENEPGAVGGWVRSGRTLRTPTFVLAPGKLYYLVRGSGHIYAAVDNHVMINGPLHGRLVRHVKGDADRRQWVEHDLSPYVGRHCHLQFSPAAGAEFAVERVIQSAQPPPAPAEPGRAVALAALETPGVDSPTKLAAAYRDAFTRAIGIAAGSGSGVAPANGDAARLDFALRRPALLGIAEWKSPALEKYFAEREKLLAAVKWDSHTAPALWDGPGEDERVFVRGSHKALGDVVPRRFLEALDATPLRTSGSGRLELAERMLDPKRNPLIARVIVNRLWHHVFGRGIVASTDNFGVLGETPSRPELLDYLAEDFVKGGWSIKRVIRSMMLSSTYRMASVHGPAGAEADRLDPKNILLHRMNVRRLSGEAIRDTLLSLSGRLDRRMFGPPVPVYLTAFMDGRGRPPAGPLDGDGRRSVYIAVRRNFLAPMMTAFDAPIPFSTVGRRMVSNVPAQALILMNDPLVHQQAAAWAKRLMSEPNRTTEQRIDGMYRAAFARVPDAGELAGCLEFLREQAKLHGGRSDDPRPWADLAHVLFNVKEFIFVK